MPDTSSATMAESMASQLTAAGFDLNDQTPLVSGDPSDSSSGNPQESLEASILNGTVDKAAPAASSPPALGAEAAPATTPSNEPPSPPAVMDYLKTRYGADFTGQFKSDEAFLQSQLELRKKIGERDEYAQLGRLAAEQPDKYLELLRERQPHLFPKEPATLTQPAPAAPALPTGLVPDLDPDHLQWLEGGRLKDNAPAEVVKAVTQWYQAKQLAKSPIVQQLLSEQQALKAQLAQRQQPGVDPASVIDERLEMDRQKRYAEEFVSANQEKLFTQHNGVRVLNQDGFAFYQALQEAANQGANFDLAIKHANMAYSQSVAARTPAPAKPQPNQQVATRQADPSRPTTAQTPEHIRDGEDAAASIMRQFKAMGIPLSV